MKMKGKICLLMAILMVAMVAVLIIPAVADGGGANIIGDTSRFMIEKNVFYEGEPIYVTAIGEGYDWVGIIHESGGSSIRYYYLGQDASKGYGSGVKVDLRKAPRGSGGKYANFPEGNYTIYFFPNDGSMPNVQPIAYAKIKIIKNDNIKPKVVNSATYELENDTDGYAKGKVVVHTDADQTNNVDIVMYWGDKNGKLKGYGSLAKFKVTGTTTVENISDGVIIPYGATKLMIYSRIKSGKMSEDCYVIDLPEGSASKNYQNPLFSYTVVSDVHITMYDSHIHNKHFKNMLEDVTKLRPDSVGNIIVGDVADQGNPNELKKMDKIYKSVNGVAPLYMSVGDHDMRGGMTIPDKAKIFNSYITLPGTDKHPEKLHYDFWLNGYHFIFLGTDEVHDWSISTLHRDTLKWLDETLAENYDPNRPAFIFLHQPLPNTVVGSLKDKYNQYWGQINPSCERDYRKVLAKYPEAILFNGHTHGLFNSESNIYKGDPKLPTIINTAAVAYEWDTYYDKYEGEDVRGSEGYIVDVYPEKIVLKGRNFETGEWVPNAQYILRYSEDLPVVTPEGTETQTETPSGTQTETEIQTKAPIDSESQSTSAETDKEAPKENKSVLKNVLLILGSVIVAAGVVAGIVLITKKH